VGQSQNPCGWNCNHRPVKLTTFQIEVVSWLVWSSAAIKDSGFQDIVPDFEQTGKQELIGKKY
jgi:hypothetical protein